MILYHGTTAERGKQIEEKGFTQKEATWKVASKPGFVYFSLAYAPFYSTAQHDSNEAALVKVEVQDDKLYPDDDFIMLAVLGKKVYTQEDLDSVDLEDYKYLADASLLHLGSASAKIEDIIIIGVSYFDATKLLHICDPMISPLNYKIMGDYYKKLTETLYDGGIEAAIESCKQYWVREE
jgi:hypothetical protein